MSSLKLIIRVAIVTGLLLLLGACVRYPAAEIDSAEQAFADAHAVEAETYAADEWRAAHEALIAAEAEIAVQESRLAPLRSYGEAVAMLTDAEGLARSAESTSVIGRNRACRETEAAVARLRSEISRATMLINEQELGLTGSSESARDLGLRRQELLSLNETIAEIEIAIGEGRIQQASTMAVALENKASALVSCSNDARSKIEE
jgi:hypothetical protein